VLSSSEEHVKFIEYKKNNSMVLSQALEVPDE
jgi:hypothetical protein